MKTLSLPTCWISQPTFLPTQGGVRRDGMDRHRSGAFGVCLAQVPLPRKGLSTH
ncbi:MAG: hypothetical protein AAGE52_05575 [Myxococcota bacterium]